MNILCTWKLWATTPSKHTQGMEGVNPSSFTDWGLHEVTMDYIQNGTEWDVHRLQWLFLSCWRLPYWVFFFTMGMLGVARGVCDLMISKGSLVSGNVLALILSWQFLTIPEPPFPNPDTRYQYKHWRPCMAMPKHCRNSSGSTWMLQETVTVLIFLLCLCQSLICI